MIVKIIDRRALISGALAAGVMLRAAGAAAKPPLVAPEVRPQTRWPDEPAMTAPDGFAQLPDVKLWYWDTGGSGEVIILLHPGTGSGAVWPWQQAALARAGYRVIGYSRRGFYRSEAGPADRTGTGAGDLAALMDSLGIHRAHIVGSAAGGFIVPDFTLAWPDRVLSATIANSLAGIVDAEWARDTERLTTTNFRNMPADFRELSGSYKIANPTGAAHWLEIEENALAGPRVQQGMLRKIDWAAFGAIRAPMLILTGDADIYMPPARARMLAARLPGAEVRVISEAGHAAHWEQPEAFNRVILDFIQRHRSRHRQKFLRNRR